MDYDHCTGALRLGVRARSPARKLSLFTERAVNRILPTLPAGSPFSRRGPVVTIRRRRATAVRSPRSGVR